MIVDTSAVIAIFREELGFEPLLVAMATHDSTLSAAAALETAIVLDRADPSGASNDLDRFMRRLQIRIAPVTAIQFEIARRGHQRFGRGSGSAASLNFGDCLTYALAIDANEPLLFVGNDFTHTDVIPALPT